MKRWSKLQKQLYDLRSSEINFQIHCSVYRMKSQRGNTDIPRYWITLDKEIIWDYPRDFMDQPPSATRKDPRNYPHENDISDISALFREYIDTPKSKLLDKNFENDHWGLMDILRAADRRFGARRLRTLKEKLKSRAALKIINRRLAP
ncbi:MAG: hypothetical protein MI747_11580 [Desulfobacterales bacterium]|nr:hypothetical protein [Desulfobacterales bacterium]